MFISLFSVTMLSLTAGIASAYENPLQFYSLTKWLMGILSGLQGIVAILAIIMLVIAGIIYISSGVNQAWITTAKNMATWALIGFTVAVALPSLLKEINNIFQTNPTGSPDIVKQAKPIKEILMNILNFLLTIIGISALISFVIGGFKYLTSGGDRGSIDSAKKIIFYSILAILVSGSGVIIVRQLLKLLEG